MTQITSMPNNNQVRRSEDGAWRLHHRHLYLHLQKLLQAAAIADTYENRLLAIPLVMKLAREAYPDAVLHITE